MKILIRTLVITLLLTGAVIYKNVGGERFSGEAAEKTEYKKESASLVASQPLEVKVTTKTIYLDGNSEVEEKMETIWSMEDFWAAYEGWTLLEQGEGYLKFEKRVDDLSPEVKADGYFGIDLNNQLTIFIGRPAHGKAVESFFPLPVNTLESWRMKDLKNGIKITDKEQFRAVVKTYTKLAQKR
ncbi:BofC C-terminal domain-containing protein [Thalassobacillus pellis]|uniref:BofC C-terminal domain-containing protein n=1 Tax=Thalassobacillus pellis TaxID=748008 RepID=UPI001960D665|nr:BofC C-terminal domain-containing protein [Thalassobacillus pellis]MBM7554637.1 forespore regulator of the sigma-K checkpoint [Thalassobacillus pellis]